MVRFTRKRALVCGAAAFVTAIVGTFAIIKSNSVSAEGETVTQNTSLWVGGWIGNTTYFKMMVDGEEKEAWCGDRNDATPWGAGAGWRDNYGRLTMNVVTVDENSSYNDKMIFGVMYLGKKLGYSVSGGSDNYPVIIHNALDCARRTINANGVCNLGTQSTQLYNETKRQINEGILFDGIKDTKYYVTNTKAIDNSWQRIYTYTYAEQKEETFDLSVKKNWNDTNVESEIYDTFNNNLVAGIVPHSADVNIKATVKASFNGRTETIREWELNSSNGYSASETGISCRAIKSEKFGVNNDYTCAGLTLNAEESVISSAYSDPIVFSSSVNPQSQEVLDGSSVNFVYDNQFYTTFVNVNKTWEDKNSLNSDERPHYITFNIAYRVAGSSLDEWANFKTYEKLETACSKAINNSELDDTQKDAICRETNEQFTFDNLPAYLKINGQFTLVEYKAIETNLYDANLNDITSKYTKTEGDITFADSDNSRSTSEALINNDLTSLPVEKQWIGDNNYPSHRPQSIHVDLLCGDTPVLDDNGNQVKLELTAANNWSASFEGLSVRACDNYRVRESEIIPHYSTIVSYENDHYILRNYHEVNIKVMKEWTGDEPDVPEIRVGLYCSNDRNTLLAETTLNAANNWEDSTSWAGRDYNECGGGDKYYVGELGYDGDFAFAGEWVHEEYGLWIYEMENIKHIDIPVEKAWVSRSDELKTTEATVVLLCQDEQGNFEPYKDNGVAKELVLNEANNWSGAFTNILSDNCRAFDIAEKTADGVLIEENEIVTAETASGDSFKFKVHYSGSAAKGFTVTNDVLMNIPVEKIWEDEGDDLAEHRPSPISALLVCRDTGNTIVIKSMMLNESNDFKGVFEDLKSSECSNYELEEVMPSGHNYDGFVYETKVEGNEADGFVITNTKYVDVPVAKVWNYRDPSNIPSSIQITLTCNDVDYGEPVTLTRAENMGPSGEWGYKFKHLLASDCPTGFSAREIMPAGQNYESEIKKQQDGTIVIVNTEQFTIPVEKRWDTGKDDNDLPDSVDVELVCGNTSVQTITLLKSEGWKGEFGPFKKGSCDSTYSINEVTEFENVGIEITGNDVDGFLITNIEFTSLFVNKTWEKRDTTETPDHILLRLICKDDGRYLGWNADVYPDALGNWSYTFTRLKTSECSDYDVEEFVPGSTVFVETKHEKVGNTVYLENTEQIIVPVRKYWNNSNNTIVPEEVNVSLYCDDTFVESTTLYSPFYYHEFGPYNMNDCSGSYNVREEPELEGFSVTSSEMDGVLVLTNTEQMDITVKKEWEKDGHDEIELPYSIEVALWCEDTNMEVPDQRVRLWYPDYVSGWNNLDYDTCESYGVREVAADGSTILSTVGDRYNNYFFFGGVSGSAAEGFTITNSYDGVDIDGEKTWIYTDDYGNTQTVSKRPTQVTINLLQNDVIIDTQVVTADASGKWNYNFDGYPRYDANGNAYNYAVDEVEFAYYEKTINGYNITNQYAPEYTSVTAAKDWATLKDTQLPDQIEVRLYCGENDLERPQYITKASNWAAVSWNNLDVSACEAGYSVKEVLSEDSEFASSVRIGSNNEYTFTNAETVNVPVKKEWVKKQSTALPESVTVGLFCELNNNKTKLDEQLLNEANNWSYTWTERNVKNDNCEGGAYVVDEISNVENFKKTSVDYTASTGYTIVNTELTSQKVIKVWEGDTAQDRPGSITADLMCGNTIIDTVELSEANNADGDNTWEYNWDNLLVSDCEQSYSVRESVNVPNYKTSTETLEDGTVVVTNRRTTDVKVIKVWKNDSKEDRPGYIEASLLCGDKTIDTVKLSEENNLDGDNTWEYTWKDLYVSDCEQGYSVTESIDIPNYHKTIKKLEDGTFEITNELDNPETSDGKILGIGSIAGLSAAVLTAGAFVSRRFFGRR